MISAPEAGLASRLRDTTGRWMMRKRLVMTEKGYLGMSPVDAQKGDICVLYGSSVPLLLRRCEAMFKFVRECYVDGFMTGEVLTRGYQPQDFVLI